jgi:hypothetical protein
MANTIAPTALDITLAGLVWHDSPCDGTRFAIVAGHAVRTVFGVVVLTDPNGRNSTHPSVRDAVATVVA